MVVLAVAAMALMAGPVWAIYYRLAASKDDWGLKYDVQVSDAGGDKLNVVFTVADEGRLKPLYSVELISLSKQTDSMGGHSYDVREFFKLKPADDGKLVGQVQIPKQFADRATFRILTQMVDGKRQPSGGAYISVPLKKYLDHAPVADSPEVAPLIASPPTSNFTK